jgi:hypothetical protein
MTEEEPGKWRGEIADIWAGLGLPAACVAMLTENRHHWFGEHPLLTIITLGNFVFPSMIARWMAHYRRKSRNSQ